ncbi:MAG: sulfite exporter TauE/SafE family protein [Pseudomonadota bacterium]
MFEFLLLFGAGVLAGWINVMAGGGSILTVPAMVFIGMPGPVANGTNRIGIITQNLSAVFRFFRGGYSDFKLSASLAAAAALGALFGANVGVQLSGVWFDRVLALVMVGVLIIMLTDFGQKPVTTQASPKNLLPGHILMIGAGFWGGFIQVGVGFIMMPIINRVMGLDLVRVNMHKTLVALVFSVVALFIFARNVDIEWTLGAALAAGFAIGGWFGARSAIKDGEALIKRIFYLAIIAMIIKLLFF